MHFSDIGDNNGGTHSVITIEILESADLFLIIETRTYSMPNEGWRVELRVMPDNKGYTTSSDKCTSSTLSYTHFLPESRMI